MIVGISGKAGSGKSTLGAFLVERIEGAVQVNFGDEIRELLCRMYAAAPHNVYGSQEGRNAVLPCGLTVREVQQRLATDLRAVWSGALVYAWSERLVEAYAQYGLVPVIACDVRMRNEVEAIRIRGGIVIRLTRNSAPDAERSWVDRKLQWPVCLSRTRSQIRDARRHFTETDLDGYEGFDLVIDNDDKSPEQVNSEALAYCREQGIF